MAFPWLSEANFEAGTLGHFNSETDTNAKLDFPHYSVLAARPGIAMPWRGAYCMRIDLAGGTADAYVQENDDWDIALDGTQYFRWMMWVDPDLTMADADEFAIFKLQSTGPVDEVVCVINFTDANGLRIGVGETGGTQFLPLPTGKWVAVEIFANIDAGTNDGTIDLWLDGAQATQVTGLTQAAIIQGRLGAMDIDAGTTEGVLLFDSVISDDAQIYPPVTRFPRELLLTASGHAFVGNGKICNVTLLSGGAADNVVSLFDTDLANTNDASNILLELKNTAASETVDPAGVPVRFTRGCYVSMSGTNPRALLQIDRANGYGSEGAIRAYARKRTHGTV